jgi:hypothetical protein
MVAACDGKILIVKAFALMVIFLIGPIEDAIAPGRVSTLLIRVFSCAFIEFIGG